MGAQVVYGRKALVVVRLGEVAVIEKRPTIRRVGRVAILRQEARLVQADEELRVDLRHLLGEKPLQQIEPLAPTVVAAALTAMHPRVGSGLRRREHAAPPCRLTLEATKIAFVIEHRPSYRSRSDIQPNLI